MSDIVKDLEEAVNQLKAIRVQPTELYVHPNVKRDIELLKQSSLYKLSDKEKNLNKVVDRRRNVLGCRR
jgi:hypothetical protein